MAEIKSCPFCGSVPALGSDKINMWVECLSCDATSGRYQSPTGDHEGARRAAIAAWNYRAEPQTCQCPACREGVPHASDCAVHNEPAYPNGKCDCGARAPFAWATFDGEGGCDLRLYAGNETYRDEYIARNGEKYSGWVKPLYEGEQPQSVVPEGWKLVPVEITEDMHAAAVKTLRHCHGNDDFPPRIYGAMIAAAPSPAKEG